MCVHIQTNAVQGEQSHRLGRAAARDVPVEQELERDFVEKRLAPLLERALESGATDELFAKMLAKKRAHERKVVKAELRDKRRKRNKIAGAAAAKAAGERTEGRALHMPQS